MKRHLSLLLALLLIALLPIKVEAAKTKYIIKADVVYEILHQRKDYPVR